MEKKKLEKADVDKLKEIRAKYSENNMQLGMLATDEYVLTQQLNQVQEMKTNLFSEFSTLREDEQKLIKDLEEKYGEGQINLDEEVFIPNV